MRTDDGSVPAPAGARAVVRAWWPMAGGLALVFAAATYGRADADLWGHLRYGLDALRDRGLTSTDPYSFTQDVPWVNHEWLSEVQTAIAYQLGGVPGLVLLKALLVFFAFAIMWNALRGVRFGVKLGTMILAALGTVHITSSVRPQAWTFVFFGLLCHALVFKRPEHRRLLPVLFAMWANTHGGWVVGLGVLAVWSAAEFLTEPATRRQWIWLVPVSALATIVTPYGWRLWEFILTTVRPERDIAEWQPIYTMDAGFWGPWALVVIAVVLMFRWLPGSRLPAAGVLAMLAWSSFRVMRINSLFVEAAIILLAPALLARWPAPVATLPVRRPKGEALVAAYLFVAGVGVAGWVMSHTLTCLPVGGRLPPESVPVRMLAGAPGGRVVTFFDWGQYGLWHFGPELQVSMDGRRETVYSNDRLDQHDAIINGEPDGFAALEEWRADYAWLPATSVATRDWLASNGYRIEFESDISFLAVRADLPPLEAPGAAESACFPG